MAERRNKGSLKSRGRSGRTPRAAEPYSPKAQNTLKRGDGCRVYTVAPPPSRVRLMLVNVVKFSRMNGINCSIIFADIINPFMPRSRDSEAKRVAVLPRTRKLVVYVSVENFASSGSILFASVGRWVGR